MEAGGISGFVLEPKFAEQLSPEMPLGEGMAGARFQETNFIIVF
jgi:hypothetical protein